MEPLRSLTLVLLDGSATSVLVTAVGGAVLPALTYRGERDAMPEVLALLFMNWSIAVVPICNTLIEDDRSSGSEGYYVGTVQRVGQSCRLVWQPISTVCANRDLSASQRRTLTMCLGRLAHPIEMFDDRRLAARFDAWATEYLLARGQLIADQPTAIRHNRGRRLMAWKGSRGQSFFAKGHARAAYEANLTQLLFDSCPSMFAKTLALDAKRGWWIYEGVPGRPTEPSDLTPEAAAILGRQIARMQQRTMGNERLRTAVSRTVSLADLREVFVLINAMKTHALGLGTIPMCCEDNAIWEFIDQALKWLPESPNGFIQCDFGLANITYDGDEFRFIDNEVSCWGPVVLILASLVYRLRAKVPSEIIEEVRRGYFDEWGAVPALARCRESINHFLVLDSLLKVKRSLDRAGRTAQGCAEDYLASRRGWPSSSPVMALVRATGHRCLCCALWCAV